MILMKQFTKHRGRPAHLAVSALLITISMVSCAISSDRQALDQPNESPAVTLAPAAGVPEAPVSTQKLTDDMMYDILLAEIAGQRGDMQVSVSRYLQAANVARDPRVAERAVQVASFAKQYGIALEAARRWVVLDSQNLDARKALTALALQQGDLDVVVAQMDFMLGNSADPEGSFRMVTAMLARHEDKAEALKATRLLVDRYPDNPYAWMAMCRLAVVSEQLDTALDAVDRALVLQPDITEASLLKAQVLVRLSRSADATAVLKSATQKHPQDTDLLFAYGRMLLDGSDLEGAKNQFARVVEIDPEYADGLYSLALLELETRDFVSGEKHLMQLLGVSGRRQNAYYYLGYVAREQGNDKAALDWYLKVESGDYWSQAQLRAADIMVKQGDIERMQSYLRTQRQKNPQQIVQLYIVEGQVLTNAGLHQQAFDVYGKALSHSPDNEDLLYSHSLAAEKLGKLAIAEENMRRILEQDPDNVRTLNALGYTLADRTNRYDEALQYISKAYAQEPDDPAIIDSMGWVHFRLGDLDKARTYLQQAWDKSKDSEIGAHFGEVLWMSGEHDAAVEIWELSRESSPDNALLLEVINRLNP